LSKQGFECIDAHNMMDEQRRITKKQLFISLLICSNFLLAGGIKNHQQVQEATALFEIWLEAQRYYHQLPGLTMAVVHDQETIWSGGYGYVNSYKQIIYDLATPCFTATNTIHENGIDPSRVKFSEFEGGHMMYNHQPSFDKFLNEVRDFVMPKE
jgi:hypothetical protein